MAISLASIKRGASEAPPRILIYGVQGIGKSTFGASAPAPIFLPTEDGLGVIDVPSFPLARSYQDVLDALNVLITEDHEFSTLVVDSLDWLEPLIWRKLCEHESRPDKPVYSIEEFGYGKGYIMALGFWREYIDGINYLRDRKKMMILQTAHSDVKRYEAPDTDAYDRYIVKLHKGASALMQEHSDCVLFANYNTGVTQEKLGFNQTRKRAIGGGIRMLHTQEKPAYAAKNRYGLPESIPLDGNTWDVLARHVPYLKRFLPDAPPPGVEGEGAV